MSHPARLASALFCHPPAQRWDAAATGAVIVCSRAYLPPLSVYDTKSILTGRNDAAQADSLPLNQLPTAADRTPVSTARHHRGATQHPSSAQLALGLHPCHRIVDAIQDLARRPLGSGPATVDGNVDLPPSAADVAWLRQAQWPPRQLHANGVHTTRNGQGSIRLTAPDPAGEAAGSGRSCGSSISGHRNDGRYAGYCHPHGPWSQGCAGGRLSPEGTLYDNRIASSKICRASGNAAGSSADGGGGGRGGNSSTWAFGRRRAGGGCSGSSRRDVSAARIYMATAVQPAVQADLSRASPAWLADADAASYSSRAAAVAGGSPDRPPPARTRRGRSAAVTANAAAANEAAEAAEGAPTARGRRKSRATADGAEADTATSAPAAVGPVPPAAGEGAGPAASALGPATDAAAPAAALPPRRRRGRPSAADIAARAAAEAAARASTAPITAGAAAAPTSTALASSLLSTPPPPHPPTTFPSLLPSSVASAAPASFAAEGPSSPSPSPSPLPSSPGPEPDGEERLLEMHDAAGLFPGVVAHVGGVEAWHRDYLREIQAAPGRSQALPLPSLEQFQRQLQMEDLSRDLALEDYRREVQGLVSERLVERALPARRLTAEWVPHLAQRIQEQIDRFLALEVPPGGSSQSKCQPQSKSQSKAEAEAVPVAEPKKRSTRQEAARRRLASTVTLSNWTRAADRPDQPAMGPTAAADTAGAATAAGPVAAVVRGGGGAGGVGGADAAAAAGVQTAESLESLASWVPWVLPLPPPLLARAVVSAILNSIITYDNASEYNELPPGMGLSITVVDTLGRRVAEILAYMRVCELVCEKRKLVQAASKHFATEQARAQVASGNGDGATGGGAGAGDGAGGGSGDPARRPPWGYDQKLEVAAARLRQARTSLNTVQMAARLMLPTGMSNYVVQDGTTRAVVLKADDTRARAHLAGAEPLNRRLVQRLQPILDMAGRVEVWDQATRIKIGAGLLQVALSSLQVTNPETGQPEPAFRHTTRAAVPRGAAGFQTPGMVVAHPQVLRWLEGDEELRRLLQPQFMPMVVEPRPWSNVRSGGFLTTSVPAMKSRFSPMIISRLKDAHAANSMRALYDGLTVLGNVPWRVNTRVLEVMQRVLESGGGKLGLPPSSRRSLPSRFTSALNDHHREVLGGETPEQCGTPYMRLQREGLRGGQLLVGAGAMSNAEDFAYQQSCDEVRMANRNESGQRCTALYRMEVAKQFSGLSYDQHGISHSTGMLPPLPLRGGPDGSRGGPDGSQQPVLFFQPHHIDFRGRAYPLHPFLSHMADDGARGLLQFGEGRPLGERGMRWLLIQLANLWGQGVDKYPLDERVAWAERMLPLVRASAARPLDGEGTWWQQGEKPWQLLGTCFEVDAALRSEGGPAAFISHQPVNQDGTCNGLQHYAALGRDRGGGAAVNLLPASRPQDVYQAVANAVAERVARDRTKGRSEAAKVHGSVDRKLVKQTVMTYVYGVTIVGAREQIENRLEERGWTNARERRKVATYLAKVVFDSMADVFGPATAVRSWLDACARHAVSAGQPVMWSSALGFPIEQPYRKLPTLFVKTGLQRFSLRDCSDEAHAPLDSRRQRSGFPPNYIHSLDGAHMMMTAMRVRREGGCFAAVHDSFWTHAASVEDMNRIIRDTFIELHSRPLLHELRAELAANPLYRAATEPLPPVPAAGDLDLEIIRHSTYFFS